MCSGPPITRPCQHGGPQDLISQQEPLHARDDARAIAIMVAFVLPLTFLVIVGCGGALATGPKPFKLDWETSVTEVQTGESFTLTVRMFDVQREGEQGGISVSFPLLTDGEASGGIYMSTVADVKAIYYTSGLSNVTLYSHGETIYHKEDNRMFPAMHLLVESDDPSWSPSDDRTLTLRITPKGEGEFVMMIRGWICAVEYTRCKRNPVGWTVIDQQGYGVDVVMIAVNGDAD